MVFEVKAWIVDISDKRACEIKIGEIGTPFVVKADIGLPTRFLSSETVTKMLEGTASYLGDQIIDAKKEIIAFCNDLKSLGY